MIQPLMFWFASVVKPNRDGLHLLEVKTYYISKTSDGLKNISLGPSQQGAIKEYATP